MTRNYAGLSPKQWGQIQDKLSSFARTGNVRKVVSPGVEKLRRIMKEKNPIIYR